jgi:Putative restriction endonuclease
VRARQPLALGKRWVSGNRLALGKRWVSDNPRQTVVVWQPPFAGVVTSAFSPRRGTERDRAVVVGPEFGPSDGSRQSGTRDLVSDRKTGRLSVGAHAGLPSVSKNVTIRSGVSGRQVDSRDAPFERTRREKERGHGDGPEAQRRTREIEYPSGDGKPVAETGRHVRELLGTFQLLDDHFAGRPHVFVGGNMFLFYVKGSRRKHISPDVMVTIGIPKEPPRDYHLVWEEGKAPDFIIEITSKSTKREDKPRFWPPSSSSVRRPSML